MVGSTRLRLSINHGLLYQVDSFFRLSAPITESSAATLAYPFSTAALALMCPDRSVTDHLHGVIRGSSTGRS